MNLPVDFGADAFQRCIEGLTPQLDYGPEGESQDEPWTDDLAFGRWLVDIGLGHENCEFLSRSIPRVTLALNHGPLFGVERFMEENSDDDHELVGAGFLIVGSGPNGDFIVIDMRSGSGKVGWLPMARVYSMSSREVRDAFVATNPNLGDFLRASEEEWPSVPKDYYDALAGNQQNQ